MHLPLNPRLIPYAKELRKNMTPQERKLWYGFLKNHTEKFYRQRIINGYIADFYHSKLRLVIEVDGMQHYTPEGLRYDENRTKVFEQYQIRVIRFRNDEIEHQFSNVCNTINQAIKSRR